MYDVCIVGSGMAGLCAGLAALELHADVVILEKHLEPGGTTRISDGIFNAYDPQRQDARSISDSPQKHLRDTLRFGSYQNQPSQTAFFCYEAYSTLSWLEQHGIRFRSTLIGGPGLTSPRGHLPSEGGGDAYVRALKAECLRLGGVIRCGCEAVGFQKEREGWAVTLRDGQAVHARALVLACGGFAANTELMSSVAPRSRFASVPPTASGGELISAAVDAGARLIADNFLQWGMLLRGNEHAAFAPRARFPSVFSNPAAFIAVDADGERFVREDVPVEELLLQGLSRPDGRFFLLVPAVLTAGDKRLGKPFGSIDEAAKTFGIHAEHLRRTIADYNGGCRTGRDAFGRSPKMLTPFADERLYAAEARVQAAATLGGLLTTPDGEVLDRLGRVMPGLYAAGECAGGIHGRMALKGNLLASAAVFGRSAGRSAAGFASVRHSKA